ncbi:MAG TPA: hypothetical protein VNW15_09025 [Rhizomicrobium sp.]|jgi:hypothetical protein|nr:hypothetical protein [Rhizomicrobium sp.]
MTERLLSFLFLGILLALAYHFGIDLIYQRFFTTARLFEAYWYIPFVAAPALLLGALAWGLGFYRPGGRRGADAIVTVILAALVFLTIPASYSCGLGCF